MRHSQGILSWKTVSGDLSSKKMKKLFICGMALSTLSNKSPDKNYLCFIEVGKHFMIQ